MTWGELLRLIDFKHEQGLCESQRIEKRWGGFFVLIQEGDMFPRGYGLAWRDPWCLRAWTCPVPFNLLAGLIRRGWHLMMKGIPGSPVDELRQKVSVLERQLGRDGRIR